MALKVYRDMSDPYDDYYRIVDSPEAAHLLADGYRRDGYKPAIVKLSERELEQGAMSATDELLMYKRERDEALDALSNLQSVICENLSYGLQFTGHTSRLEDAEAILRKHNRLPAAGGAE